jgi:ubiquinone/menaquinone biosynthesis C-methylase UbiE
MSTSEERLDFSFDTRVAVQYDALRGHPPEVAAQVGRAIAAEAGSGARILELGVGTGRIASPTVAAGCEVVGIDLSAHMLSNLAQREEARSGRLSLVRGDITRLPFQDAAFDGAVCVHVLHLVDDSRDVLAQLLRLTRPGCPVMLGRDWVDPASFAGQIRNLFRQAVVDCSETVSMPTGARGFVQQMLELGAEAENQGAEKTAVEWETELTPRQVLDGIRSRDDAESWVLPDGLLARVMERLDAHCDAQWPDRDAPHTVKRRFVYSLFRAPASVAA